VDRSVHPGIMRGVHARHQCSAPNRFGSMNHARVGQRRDASHGKIRQAFPRTEGIARASPRTGSGTSAVIPSAPRRNRFASHPTTIAKAIGYANVGIALGRGIDRANQGFPLLQAQWAEDAPSRMLRGAYPRPPHPRYETADLAMIRQGI
jgi:hypothetical protein